MKRVFQGDRIDEEELTMSPQEKRWLGGVTALIVLGQIVGVVSAIYFF